MNKMYTNTEKMKKIPKFAALKAVLSRKILLFVQYVQKTLVKFVKIFKNNA